MPGWGLLGIEPMSPDQDSKLAHNPYHKPLSYPPADPPGLGPCWALTGKMHNQPGMCRNFPHIQGMPVRPVLGDRI